MTRVQPFSIRIDISADLWPKGTRGAMRTEHADSLYSRARVDTRPVAPVADRIPEYAAKRVESQPVPALWAARSPTIFPQAHDIETHIVVTKADGPLPKALS